LSESLKVTANEGGFVSFKTSYRVHHRLVTTNSTLRFASQKQVEDLLSRSGLALREILGDWDARPFEPARSREMIFIAESKPIHLDRP